jgi:hypothetical protein
MMTLQSTVRVSANVVFKELAQEGVLLHTSTSQYYGLRETSLIMWKLLAQTGSVQETLRRMLEEFEVEEPVLRQDLLRFVEELTHERLLVIDQA